MNYLEWRQSFIDDTELASDVRPRAVEQPPPGTATRFRARASEVVVFSGSHLHQTLPNTTGRTRFSVDFRIDALMGLQELVAAQNIGVKRNDPEAFRFLQEVGLDDLQAKETWKKLRGTARRHGAGYTALPHHVR